MAGFEPISPQAKDRLLPFLSFFEESTEPFYTQNQTTGFHPYSYHEQVETFIGEVYEANLIQAYDWRSWKEEATQLWESPETVEQADMDTLIKLFTYHIRQERFTNGHLAAVLDRGYFTVMLKRLGQIA